MGCDILRVNGVWIACVGLCDIWCSSSKGSYTGILRKGDIMENYPELKIRETDQISELPLDKMVDVPFIQGWNNTLEARKEGEFKGKAIHLSNRFAWVIGRDSTGALVLVPLKKH